MTKFWWKGEPLIVGSFHWQVVNNDLKNTMVEVVNQLKATTTIEEAVKMARDKGLEISFELVPK